MARPSKYKTADDLINNCEIQDNLCFVWPAPPSGRFDIHGRYELPPVLAPASPLAVAMLTNSVSRILYITCRHVPASKRLVKWCTTSGCVNPYHHSETRKVVAERLKVSSKEGKAGRFSTELLPSQQSISHLLPTPEAIEAARPVELDVLKLLQESAMHSGVDGRGIPPALRVTKVVPWYTKKPIGVDITKPLLVMKNYKPPLPADEEATLKSEIDKEAEALFGENNNIFKQIEERKKRLLQKSVQDWDLPAN
jgi:hypothetical protein